MIYDAVDRGDFDRLRALFTCYEYRIINLDWKNTGYRQMILYDADPSDGSVASFGHGGL